MEDQWICWGCESKSLTQSPKLKKYEKEFSIACQRLLSDALGQDLPVPPDRPIASLHTQFRRSSLGGAESNLVGISTISSTFLNVFLGFLYAIHDFHVL